MVVARYRMVPDPNQLTDFLQVVRSVLEPIRVQPGCRGCTLYRDETEGNIYVLIQEWETDQHLTAHFSSVTFRALLIAMDMLREPPVVNFDCVTSTRALDSIDRVKQSFPGRDTHEFHEHVDSGDTARDY
jgi:quinol monooxygenase YgiN